MESPTFRWQGAWNAACVHEFGVSWRSGWTNRAYWRTSWSARTQFGAADARCSREYITRNLEKARVELRHVSSASNQLTSLAVGRLAAVVAVLVFAGTSAAPAHPGRWYWSERDVVRQIAGTVIRVEGKRVRIASTVTCMGEGRRVVRRGGVRWKHFSCTQPILFPGGGGLAGPDALFRVHVVGSRRFRVTNARFAD
jgi:hypothetical protein